MKRRILLLTAVVMIAVMLSGCVIPYLTGIKVEYDLDPAFEAKQAEWVRRGAILTVELEYKEEASIIPVDELEISIKPEVEFDKPEEVMNEEEDKVVGIKFEIPNVGKKPLKVTVKGPAEE